MPNRQELLKINQELEQRIVERQGVEASLRQSEEKSRSLIENALDILTVLDVNGIIQYESLSIEGVLGYTPDDLLGTNILNLAHPQDVPDVLGTMQHIIQKPEAAQAVQFRCRHKDGSWRVLEAIGKIFCSANPENPLNGTVIVNARDVTDQMEERNENMEIIQAIVSLATSLRIEVVAEGVETAQQLTQLRTLACQYGQGYYFSKPLPPAAAAALMMQEPQW